MYLSGNSPMWRKISVIFLTLLPLTFGNVLLPLLSPPSLFSDSSPCMVPKSPNDSPYYFGTSDLACVSTRGLLRLIKKRSVQGIPEDNFNNRTKRATPQRNTMSPTHRWIYYRGTYFEWGTNAGTGNRLFGLLNDAKSYNIRSALPFKGEQCGWMMETVPSGYSSVSLECVMACTANYGKLTGEYSLLNNNCHHFANTISMVLCSNMCPDWCTQMM